MPSQADKAAAFRALHERAGAFIIPNPWDAGSARLLAALGFERSMVERVERMVAGAEFKRQVPPVAKLGPRTAGIDYLYPRRRPGSSRES